MYYQTLDKSIVKRWINVLSNVRKKSFQTLERSFLNVRQRYCQTFGKGIAKYWAKVLPNIRQGYCQTLGKNIFNIMIYSGKIQTSSLWQPQAYNKQHLWWSKTPLKNDSTTNIRQYCSTCYNTLVVEWSISCDIACACAYRNKRGSSDSIGRTILYV